MNFSKEKSFRFIKQTYKILLLFPRVAGLEAMRKEDTKRKRNLGKKFFEQVPASDTFYMRGNLVSHRTLRVLLEIE